MRLNGTSKPHPGPLYAIKFAGSPRQAPASFSASFRTRTGVRQGCVLAPALFCRAMDWIMDRAMLHRGVTISGENIPDSDYASDVAAFDGDLADITRTLESIEAASSELDQHISRAKTKVQNIEAGQHNFCTQFPGKWSNCGDRAELCLPWQHHQLCRLL